MSKSIFGIILALFAALQLRAEQPIFNITNTDATPGQIIDIDFHVDNFTDIIVVQYSAQWNPAVLKFRSIKNFNASVPGLSASVFGQQDVDNGTLTLAWIESSITQITIPDGSLFFTIEFEVVGAPCEGSGINITGTPTEIVVSEDGVNDVGLVANNGRVNIPGTGCTEDINIIGNAVTGPCGGSACVQFTVENFNTVGIMEFSLIYNPTILQFNEFRNFAPLPGFSSGNTNLFAPGVLRVIWIDSNVQNDSLPDGTVLFEICFDVIGNGGQSSDIQFGTIPAVLIADVDGVPHTVNLTPASITAQCQLEGFALIADTVCTNPGGLACFDVKVNDFDSLIAVQFSMNWDSTVFEFDHLENFGIPGLSVDGFGTPTDPGIDEGQIVVSWLDLSLEGVSLPDFSTIFTLCLKAKGAAGTSSPVTFTEIPLEMEFFGLPDSTYVPALLQGRGEIKVNCGIDPCDISYTIVGTDPTCPRETNGSINLTVIEDCPETPTYQWSNPPGGTTQDLSGLGAGTYTVTITVGTQVIIATETLNDPQPISVTGSITNPNPAGACNGAVDITVTGGTPPYTYNWNTTPPSSNQDIFNLCAGSYTVTVTDSKDCTFIPDPYVVGAELSAGITNVSCKGGSNGAINLSVSFGVPPYTFIWNTTPTQTTEDISNLKAGVYCVTATDNAGSTRDSCFTVTEPTAIVLTASITNDVNETCQGAIDLNVTGGTLPYTYLWSNGATTQDITQLCPAQYCVTVTDGNGCTVDTCFTVFAGGINVSLAVTQYGNFQTSCNGICDGEITSVIVGGTAPFTYHWSNGATTADISNLCAGSYTLTVTDASAQTASATTVITSPPAFTFTYITTNPTDYITSNGAIAVVVNGGTPPYTYQWTGPVTGNTAALNNVPAGTYTIHITDANGCTVQDSEQLIPDIDIPCYTAIKVITPNSDGRNDYFIISCVFDFDNHLYIYNRLGGLVYETTNYQNTWDGVNQDNEPVPDGGYHWVLEVFKQDGSTELLKGTVNLLRTAD